MKHGRQVHRLLDGLEGLATRSCGAKLTGGQIRLWAGQVRNLGALVCAERGPVNIDDAVDAHLTARGLWEQAIAAMQAVSAKSVLDGDKSARRALRGLVEGTIRTVADDAYHYPMEVVARWDSDAGGVRLLVSEFDPVAIVRFSCWRVVELDAHAVIQRLRRSLPNKVCGFCKAPFRDRNFGKKGRPMVVCSPRCRAEIAKKRRRLASGTHRTSVG